jgi:uncharacterized protein (TIGR02453 family)
MAVTQHFDPQLFAFLRRLKRNNNRPWFEKNRVRYVEEVRDPLLGFIADVGPHLQKISPQFVADPRPSGGTMFRIYRDVRFSNDKRPYKTAASAQFRHRRGKDVHAPGFYLHLEPDSVFVGAGLWHPDTATLAKIRQAIVENPKGWRRILAAKAFKTTARLGGESLKRPPRGYDADHPLIEDLKRKDFITLVALDEDTACAPDFLNRFIKICRLNTPFMKFLTAAAELQW